MKISGTRIVFVFTPLEHSNRILCLAHHMKLVFPRYQWVFVNKRLGDFLNAVGTGFTYRGRYYICSNEELVRSIMEGALLVDYQLSITNHPDENNYPQNTSLNEFLELYNQKLSNSKQKQSKETVSDSTIRWAYTIYDALWAWGIVLDRLTTNHGHNPLASEFGNKTLVEAILKEFYSLDFQGISGHISFSIKSGVIDRFVNLYQVTGGYERRVAYANNIFFVTLQDFNTIHDVVKAVTLPYIGFVIFF